eukprot:SAG22_NODE_1577_length_4074_cov_1.659371_3_plen_162_part_00
MVQDCNSGPLPPRMSSKSFPVCVLDHKGLRSCEVLTLENCSIACSRALSGEQPAAAAAVWTVVAEALQHPRKRHATCFAHDKVLVLGGIDTFKSSVTAVEGLACSSPEETGSLVPEKDRWAGCPGKSTASDLASMPIGDGRFDFAACAVGQGFVRAVNWSY